MRKTAEFVGDIKCTRVAIEDGAYFKGGIEISKGVQPNRNLALQGSSAADELDRIAESDIETGRYVTLSDDLSLERLFPSKRPAAARQTLEETLAESR